MTRDDIIEIGRNIDPKAWLGIHKDDVDWCVIFAQLATKHAVKVEREACITELERNADKTLDEIIAAIRARGDK